MFYIYAAAVHLDLKGVERGHHTCPDRKHPKASDFLQPVLGLDCSSFNRPQVRTEEIVDFKPAEIGWGLNLSPTVAKYA